MVGFYFFFVNPAKLYALTSILYSIHCIKIYIVKFILAFGRDIEEAYV